MQDVQTKFVQPFSSYSLVRSKRNVAMHNEEHTWETYQVVKVLIELSINIKGKPGKVNDKKYVKKKERERHLPGYCQ